MIGSLISKAIKVATLPLDAVEAAGDIITGGDGSAESRRASGMPLPSEIRDAVCKVAEDIDG